MGLGKGAVESKRLFKGIAGAVCPAQFDVCTGNTQPGTGIRGEISSSRW